MSLMLTENTEASNISAHSQVRCAWKSDIEIALEYSPSGFEADIELWSVKHIRPKDSGRLRLRHTLHLYVIRPVNAFRCDSIRSFAGGLLTTNQRRRLPSGCESEGSRDCWTQMPLDTTMMFPAKERGSVEPRRNLFTNHLKFSGFSGCPRGRLVNNFHRLLFHFQGVSGTADSR